MTKEKNEYRILNFEYRILNEIQSRLQYLVFNIQHLKVGFVYINIQTVSSTGLSLQLKP